MDVERDKAAILHLYEATRRGHLNGDASKLLAQYAPRWDDLRGGTVVVRTLDDELQRIASQLAGTRYLAWDDVNPLARRPVGGRRQRSHRPDRIGVA